MTDRELMQQALEDICGARLCEVNSMSSRHEMLRLMDKAITPLRNRLAQNREMDEAVAAGDGTLHGAIDYWQGRALKAEARLAQRIDPAEHDKTCAALLQGERYPCDCKPSAEPVAYRYRYIDGWRTNGGGPVNGVHPVECQPLYTAPPTREPVAYRYRYIDGWIECQPLYTVPPTRTPLTDEEIAEIAVECAAAHRGDDINFARAIERAHGIGEKK